MQDKKENVSRLNNVDITIVKQSKETFEKHGGHHYVEKVIQGEYKLDGSPAFVAEIQTEHSKFTLASDEPSILGGTGIHTSPFTYVLFGTIACYATTLAMKCAERQIRLEKLKVKGTIHYDLGPMLSKGDWPLVNELILEVESDKNITNVIKEAKCPSLYTWEHAMKTKVVQVLPNTVS